jgi:hypothetical protein
LEKLNQEAKAKGYSYWHDRFITINKKHKKKKYGLTFDFYFCDGTTLKKL